MAETTEDPRPRRRQARGERRMAEILAAAATVFARLGYEAATTNKIAAEAGISPGSLYQFFTNKEAIARALVQDYLLELGRAHRGALDLADPAGLGLVELVDRAVDPIVAFNLAHPGFKALFARPDMPPELAAALAPLQTALRARVEQIIGELAPHRDGTERARAALTCVHIVQGVIPLITSADPAERPPLTGELKRALCGYLESLVARP
ncbi:TetR/AcrR family transcriptional regulator [Streptosporangium sp. NPDC020072]|uniref:TetR/AcrR family transcriptional regulator n=1 Tax=Streptosporangium sp. NPDC020072 TaxID=3154788 RepID=UPI00341AF98A